MNSRPDPFCADCSQKEQLKQLASELDEDPAHAFQVAALAMMLFEVLQPLHGLGPEARRLLEAGALLHDTGYSRGLKRHHKLARDLIMELELPFFSGREKRITACLARYHRKGPPEPAHKVYRDLAAADQGLVRRLAAMLRIADGLDRGHCASVTGLDADIGEERVLIRVKQGMENKTDIQGGNRKAGLFREVYGLSAEIREA
jgi:exopolyphosphatase / guanosine-5'-triphosphate,3'-diphosphate pyrophosphatase